MALAAPLFLLGLLAIAVPFWLHRREVPSNERTPFASTRFLEASPRRTRVEKRLQYWLLLALRCLALAAIACAFARPFITRAPALAETSGRVHLIALDSSLSMQRGDAFAAARREAQQTVAGIGGNDTILVADIGPGGISIAREPLPRAAARDWLAAQTAGTHRLDVGELMAAAGRLAAELVDAQITLHFFSDLQQSALPARFADLVPPEALHLALYPIEANGANARIAGLTAADSHFVVDTSIDGITAASVPTADASTPITVSRQASGLGLPNRQLAVRVNDAPGPVFSRVTERTRVPADALTLAASSNRVELMLAGSDALAGDDRYYAVIDRSPPTDVLLVTTQPRGATALYLGAALAAGGDITLVPTPAEDFDTRELARNRWVVVDDPAALPDNVVTALTRFVEDGGQALVIAGEATLAAGNWLLPERAVGSAGSGNADFARIARVATDHPALSDAAPWSAVRVARIVPLVTAASDQVLVALDTGDPLVVEASSGDGRVLVLTTPVNRDWTDLGQRGAFVAFALDAARTLSGSGRLPTQYLVGERLPLDFREPGSGQVIAPDGSERVAAAATGERARVLLDIPGFYEVYTEAGQTTIAVNPDPRESDPAVMPEALQERWTQAMPELSNRPAAAGRARAEQGAAGTPLWPWLLAALAAFIFTEQLLANWFIGRQPSGERYV